MVNQSYALVRFVSRVLAGVLLHVVLAGERLAAVRAVKLSAAVPAAAAVDVLAVLRRRRRLAAVLWRRRDLLFLLLSPDGLGLGRSSDLPGAAATGSRNDGRGRL